MGANMVSCFIGNCEPVLPYYRIEKIDALLMRFSETGVSWDPVAEGESVLFENFFVWYDFNPVFISRAENTFGNELMATDCSDPGHKGSKVGVDKIYVKMMNDYNQEYMAGDTINEIIRVNGGYPWGRDHFVELEEYLSENDLTINGPPYLNLILSSPPLESNKEHQFELIYILDNGEVFTSLSPTVRLNF